MSIIQIPKGKKVLVSACLMGENVRYDGGHCNALVHNNSNFMKLKTQGRLLSFCPECAGGLSTPRKPAEIKLNSRVIYTEDGTNVTDAFELGARKTLEFCKKNNIEFAILKENSPSCGSTQIYDGSFTGQKVNGVGITTKLLKENGITVLSENDLDKLNIL